MSRGDHRRDAVRLEQAADDVGLDLRRRAEDDDQLAPSRSHRHAADGDERLFDLEQDHRHVVVLVGAADERLDLAQDALAQLAGVEVAVLLDDAG